jgi:thiol-disulfide isomerase/thioredoxin
MEPSNRTPLRKSLGKEIDNMKRIGLGILSIACIQGCSHGTATRSHSDPWEPVGRPRSVQLSGDSQSVVILQTDPGLAVSILQIPREEEVEFRPYLLVDGRRVEFSPAGMLGTEGVSAAVFSSRESDGLPKGRARLGLERLTPDGRRKISLAAFAEAQRRGFPVLPAPEPGKPYPFKLKTHSGEILDSESLRGRVVLVDCWATWCGPCMALMPAVVELTRIHGDQLVVISVTLDENADEALKKLRTIHGETVDRWRHVSVPPDLQALWNQSLESKYIPKLLLIDRDGVLREEPFPQPEALKGAVSGLLAG